MAENRAMSRLNIRPMTKTDLDQVMAIERVSFSTPWPKEAFLYEVNEKRRSICWVAEVINAGEPPLSVGSIVVWLNDEKGHIGTLSIQPEYRRQGYAQTLLAQALLACEAQGVKQVELEVRESNTPAQDLYRKFGFSAVGRQVGYYQDTHEDAINMALISLDKDHLVKLLNHE